MKRGFPVRSSDINRFIATYLVQTVMIRSNDPEFADPLEEGDLDETKCRLDQYQKRIGDKGTYYFNADEGWEITIRLEKRHRPEKEIVYPRCIKVRRGFVDYRNEQGQ